MERKPEMKKSLVSLVAAALGVLLLTGTKVWADPVPWSFLANPITNTSGVPYSAAPGPPLTPVGNLLPSSSNNPLSSILFSPQSGNQSGSTGIIIYNMTTLSQQLSSSPDKFSGVDFLASFKVSDTNSFQTATVTFHGKYTATNVSSSSLTQGNPTVAWIPDQGNLSANEAQVTLGGNLYDFLISPSDFLSSQSPGGGVGSFAVDVGVNGPAQGSGDTPPTGTPEPASLVLAGLGLPFFLLLRRRMKNAQADATVA
jgi:hypothetical protein